MGNLSFSLWFLGLPTSPAPLPRGLGPQPQSRDVQLFCSVALSPIPPHPLYELVPQPLNPRGDELSVTFLSLRWNPVLWGVFTYLVSFFLLPNRGRLKFPVSAFFPFVLSSSPHRDGPLSFSAAEDLVSAPIQLRLLAFDFLLSLNRDHLFVAFNVLNRYVDASVAVSRGFSRLGMLCANEDGVSHFLNPSLTSVRPRSFLVLPSLPGRPSFFLGLPSLTFSNLSCYYPSLKSSLHMAFSDSHLPIRSHM